MGITSKQIPTYLNLDELLFTGRNGIVMAGIDTVRTDRVNSTDIVYPDSVCTRSCVYEVSFAGIPAVVVSGCKDSFLRLDHTNFNTRSLKSFLIAMLSINGLIFLLCIINFYIIVMAEIP